MKYINYNKKKSSIVSLLLALALVFVSTGSVFASSNMNSERILEEFFLDGESYVLERIITEDKITATVFDAEGIEVSSFTNDIVSNELEGEFVNSSIGAVQPRAATDYKLVSTTTGTLKVASWTTVGIIAAIAALNPGVGSAVIAAVASAIVLDKGSAYTYKLLTYTKSEGYYFYQRSVWKFYNKGTGKKVGPDLEKYTKTHHR